MFSWIPVFVLLFIILPAAQEAARRAAVLKVIRRRRERMTNDIVLKYVGKVCVMSFGNRNITGKILEVNNNWAEVETKKGREVLNLDYVQSIKVVY